MCVYVVLWNICIFWGFLVQLLHQSETSRDTTGIFIRLSVSLFVCVAVATLIAIETYSRGSQSCADHLKTHWRKRMSVCSRFSRDFQGPLIGFQRSLRGFKWSLKQFQWSLESFQWSVKGLVLWRTSSDPWTPSKETWMLSSGLWRTPVATFPWNVLQVCDGTLNDRMRCYSGHWMGSRGLWRNSREFLRTFMHPGKGVPWILAITAGQKGSTGP